MPQFETSRQVRHSPDRMFALVADVEKYPQFLPLCEALRVRSRRREGEAELLVADMTVGYKAIRETFRSRVTLEPARLHCPILLGPHTWNFSEAVQRLLAVGGAVQLPAGGDLAAALAREADGVLSDPLRARRMAEAAAAVAADQAGLPDRLAEALLALLPASPAVRADGEAEMVRTERD